jgi:hypothetical protein
MTGGVPVKLARNVSALFAMRNGTPTSKEVEQSDETGEEVAAALAELS